MEGQDPRRWERQQIDAALTKLTAFRDECEDDLGRASTNADFWATANMMLSLFAALVAAIAGASVLSDLVGTTVAASLALGSAGISAVNAVLRPNEAQRKWVARQDAFRTLAAEVDSYLSIDALLPRGKRNAPGLYRDFVERRLAVLSGKPLPEMWSKGSPSSAPSNDDVEWLMD